MPSKAQLTVKRIATQFHRTVVYGDDAEYKVIASAKACIKVGDIIEYEPYGLNFGFFERMVPKPKQYVIDYEDQRYNGGPGVDGCDYATPQDALQAICALPPSKRALVIKPYRDK